MKLLFGILTAFFLASCTEDDPQPGEGTPVVFSLSGIGADISAGGTTTRGENFTKDVTVRVVAYKGTSYVADNTYKVDAGGNLVATGGEMRLIEDTYDFYAISPALEIVSKTTSGPTFSVAQGVDFAAVKTTQKVTAYSGSSSSTKCAVTLGELARKCAKLTFIIEPGDDVPVVVSALKIVNVTLTDMPDLQTATGATLNAGSGSNTLILPESAFTNSGTTCSGSTIVLPKSSGAFTLSMDVQVNNSGVTVTFPAMTIPAMAFTAGMNHTFMVKLMKDRVGIWLSTSTMWTTSKQSPEFGGTISDTVEGTLIGTWANVSNQFPEFGGTASGTIDGTLTGTWDDTGDQSPELGGTTSGSVNGSLTGIWTDVTYNPSLGDNDASNNK